MNDLAARNARYWDALAGEYQGATRISTEDFHFGPLLPGDRELNLLPANLQGKICLELGCGAGQNSIALARRGARTIASDLSKQQLAYGRKLAGDAGVDVTFLLADMEDLPAGLGTFDLIHSAYGIPFAQNPQEVIRQCADRLNPGGTLLISLGHPVYAGEWLELDDDERGIFLANYFHPIPDVRPGETDDNSTCAQAWPVAETVSWILDAGLTLTALREPKPLPVQTLSSADIAKRVPYYSEAWAEQVEELSRVPIVLILRAIKTP